jgi:hypothetical protein
MRISQLIDLRLDGRNDIRMAVAETGHGRTTATVEVLLAGVVVQIDTFTAQATRILVFGISVEDAAHIETG